MPGNFQNFEIGAEKSLAWCFLHEKIRLHRFDFELKTEIAKKFAVGNHGRGKRVTTNRTTKLPLDFGDILNVIDVPVRQKQEFWLDLKRTHPFAGALRRVEENPSFWRVK